MDKAIIDLTDEELSESIIRYNVEITDKRRRKEPVAVDSETKARSSAEWKEAVRRGLDEQIIAEIKRRLDNPTISDSTASPEKPSCPFCGSRRVALVPWYELPNHSAARCRDCLAQGPPAFPKEAAWAMWERRESEIK